MATSFQNEIPPARVNIRLSVQNGNEAKRLELPLKLLVLGQFRIHRTRQRLAERERLLVHRDNIDAVMKSLDLIAAFSVPNRIDKSSDQISVTLGFSERKDFSPEAVVRQVPELGRLLAARNLLRDLGSNLMDARGFRKELEGVLRDPSARQALQDELRCRVLFTEEVIP